MEGFFLCIWILASSLIDAIQDESSYYYIGNKTLLNERNYVSIAVDYNNDEVKIVFIADDRVWNGIGFGQSIMNRTYAIIMDYDDFRQTVSERILGHHDPGTQINTGISTISDETIGNTRTLTITRAINSDYYSFPPNQEAQTVLIPMIAALGISKGLKQHHFFDREQLTFTLTKSSKMEPITTLSPSDTTETITFSTINQETSELHICCDCMDSLRCKGCAADAQCEQVICKQDPYCCSKQWDLICSIQSEAVCKSDPMPLCCSCIQESTDQLPGCLNDEECEQCICNTDPFCCADDHEMGYWDHVCAVKALDICRGYSDSANLFE